MTPVLTGTEKRMSSIISILWEVAMEIDTPYIWGRTQTEIEGMQTAIIFLVSHEDALLDQLQELWHIAHIREQMSRS